MLKKDITFTNFNDEEVTQTFFFHLSKADLIRMETSVKGGLGDHLTRIVEGDDDKIIMGEFEKLILSSYGVKSEDGNRFIKTPEQTEEFRQSEAYSDLLMELCTNEGAAISFITGIVPHNLKSDLARIGAKKKSKSGDVLTTSENSDEDTTFEGPASVVDPPIATSTLTPKPRVLTMTEAQHMDPDELNHLIASGKAVFGK